jgi:cytochrome c553
MKKGSMVVVLGLSVFMWTAFALAGKSSVDYGKQLFNGASLGGSKNSSSCNTCHADGKGLEKSGSNPKLVKVINQCITGPLEGEKIDGRTAEMRSLKMYIQSLGE